MLLNGQPVTDGITGGIEVRKQRGLEIAALARIDKQKGFYIVPSQHNPNPTQYRVAYGENPTCTCLDFETRGCRCKHIYAVEYVIRRETTIHANGHKTITESITVKKTRKTYTQDWPNYNAAQVNERRHFQALLGDLCKGIEEPAEPQGAGRKPFPLADAVYAIVYKIYSTRSARRFVSDLEEAQEKGYIGKLPHYNTIFKFIENPRLFGVLVNMIERAALPLKGIESKFAVDSTGFAFCRFVRWYDIKYNRFTSAQQWVKAHICTGVQTNVVTAIQILDQNTNDSQQLPALVNTTAEKFALSEVSADKGYSSLDNHNAIAKVNAEPFIAFKANTTGAVGGLFQKAFHYFQFKRDEFLAHYHLRSNVESTVMMIKSKFGDAVRSKLDVAAKNEVLAKVVCHNICCLISAMYELGVDPMFEENPRG